MKIPVIEQHIKTCDTSLIEIEKMGIDSSQIKYIYMRSIILEIVSEFELIIEDLFVKRADKSGDKELTSFVKTQLNNKFRSPDLSKIYTILSSFNINLKNNFFSNIQNTPKSAAWDNIMKARHSIVHKQGTLQMTYDEVKTSYKLCNEIIDDLLNQLK